MRLKAFKKLYDLIGNIYVKAGLLTAAEAFGMKKDIVRLDTNNFCNIKCIMCERNEIGNGEYNSSRIMSFDEYKLVIKRIRKSCRFLYLSCGFEPLATPNFKKYAEYAKRVGIPFVTFCTNALLLTDDVIHSLVDNKVDEIVISFNGFKKEDYERIMYKSNYDKVLDNICRLNEYKKSKDSIYPQIRLNSLLMKTNLLNFDEIIHFINKYDVHMIQFRDLCLSDNQNNVNETKNEMVSNIEPQELKKIIRAVNIKCAELRESGREIFLPKKILQSGIDEKKKVNIAKKGCTIPFFSCWIWSDGSIKICPADRRGELGNIYTDNWKEIKAKRRRFKKLALINKCDRSSCLTTNIESSAIV